MKNIDNEINRLLMIKEKVDSLNQLKKSTRFKLDFLSQCKYNEFANNGKLEEDKLYYIVDQEIGQYIEGYIG